MMKAIKQISVLAFLLVILQAPNASAVTIVAKFIDGFAPANAAGGGNLVDIVNAAVRMWESAYSDPVTIRLYFGWAPISDAGTHTVLEQGGSPNRETAGMILFDNSGSIAFYLDPTPDSNEEYGRRTEEYQNLGGGLINVARLFSNPVGNAVGGTDLFSVALHEIGHAMGMSAGNASFVEKRGKGAISITGDRPFTGTVIPLASNNAGFTTHIDPLQVRYGSIMQGICSDERRMPSALDILANAQISGFEILTLDPQQVPQSVTMPTRTLAPQQVSQSTASPSRGIGRMDQGIPSQRSIRK